jgi:hypothetical protein
MHQPCRGNKQGWLVARRVLSRHQYYAAPQRFPDQIVAILLGAGTNGNQFSEHYIGTMANALAAAGFCTFI